MNNKRIAKNIGISMVMKPISMLLTFVYTPMFLSYLGQEKYGVWAIVVNVISWITYFDIGIGNGLKNKLTEAVAQGDEKSAQKYVSTAFVGTTFISIVFFILMVFIWIKFDLSKVFHLNVSGVKADVVIVISVSFVCLNFILSLFKTSAYAIQQPGLISVVSVVGQLIQIVVILVLPFFVKGSIIAVAIMYGTVTIIDNIILSVILLKKRKYLAPRISLFDSTYLKPLLTLGLGFFVMQICGLVLNTTDNLLIANLFGTIEVTTYSMVYKVFYIVVQVHGIIIMPMWSAYTEAASKGDFCWIKRTLRRINLITVVMSFCTIIGVFVFKPFSMWWLGQRLNYSFTLIILIALYMIFQMFANNYSAFVCGVGEIKASVFVSAVGAIVNIPLSVFFAKTLEMRLNGIILGSLCVVSLCLVVLPVVTYKWLKKGAY